MYTAALLAMAQTYKQPKCPSVVNDYLNCGTATQGTMPQQLKKKKKKKRYSGVPGVAQQKQI